MSKKDINKTERLLISESNLGAIGGVSRVSAISVMFEGYKHRKSSALTDDRAHTVRADRYETRKEEVWNGLR